MKFNNLILLCLIVTIELCNGTYKLQERFRWNQMDWAFPSQRDKEMALASGDYIPQNALPVGVNRYQNKLFVTVPRWRDGIPATLNYIDLDRTPSGSPELIPYPDWESNTVGDCVNGLNTVYRITVDKCNRLWVLDTGTIGTLNETQNVCPYSVNIFDLTTNRRIRRYNFRPEDTNPKTFIANTAIDIGKSCEDAFAYFSDELGYGLIAYSFEENKSWRFEHSFFFPDPLRGDFNIAGLNFQWGAEGIFGIALSPMQSDGFRTLYFSPLASHREFTVSTRILRDESRVEDSFHDFSFLDERAPNGHTTSQIITDDGIMLFNLIDQNAVGCWHTSNPYSPRFHGIVDRDDVGLVFPADVIVDVDDDVWVLSDRMHVFYESELDFSDINFRIYSSPLSTLIEGTVCDKGNRGNGGDINNRFSGNDYPSYHNEHYYGSKQHDYYPHHSGGGYYRPTNSPYNNNNNRDQYLRTTDNHLDTTSSQSFKPSVQPLTTLGLSAYSSREPHSQAFTTQRVPKAYIFNQHNGVAFEAANSPHEFTSGSALPDMSAKPTWWSSKQLW